LLANVMSPASLQRLPVCFHPGLDFGLRPSGEAGEGIGFLLETDRQRGTVALAGWAGGFPGPLCAAPSQVGRSGRRSPSASGPSFVPIEITLIIVAESFLVPSII